MAFDVRKSAGLAGKADRVLQAHLENARAEMAKKSDTGAGLTWSKGSPTRPSSDKFEEQGAYQPEFATVARENPDAVYDLATRSFHFTQALNDAENGVFGRGMG